MIKNQSNIYRFPMEDHLGKGVTGLAPTIKLSKDGGTFAAATNSVTEPDTTNAPGLYQLILTAEECNCNLLTLVVNVPTGEWGAILTEFDMQSPSDTSGLATAEALSSVATNVSAVKAKTDNLPANPAAIGDAMTLTSAYDAAKTASQFDPEITTVTIDNQSVQAVQSGLSTFNPATDAVTIATAQASTLATATAQAAQTAAINKLDASILHWSATASTLTLYDNNGAVIGVYDLTRDSSGNITAIEPHAEG